MAEPRDESNFRKKLTKVGMLILKCSIFLLPHAVLYLLLACCICIYNSDFTMMANIKFWLITLAVYIVLAIGVRLCSCCREEEEQETDTLRNQNASNQNAQTSNQHPHYREDASQTNTNQLLINRPTSNNMRHTAQRSANSNILINALDIPQLNIKQKH